MTLIQNIFVFTRLTFNAHLLHLAVARERLTVNAIRNRGRGTENLWTIDFRLVEMSKE